MLIYFLTIGLSIGIYLILNHGKVTSSISDNKRAYLPLVAASLPPMVVSAIRYNVGTDYFTTYYSGFYRILNGSLFDQFEIGYWLVNKAVQLFTDNVFVLFALTAVLFVGFTYAAIGSLSDNVVLSIMMLMFTRYYFISMNGVRQFIALAIFAYAMRYVVDRNLKKFLLFACLAMSFHVSTFVLLPIYWLIQIDPKPKYTVIGTIALLVGGNVVLGMVSAVIPDDSKYGSILSSSGSVGTLFTIGTIGINILMTAIYYSGYKKRESIDKYRCYLWMQILATMCTMLLPVLPPIERIYWSFSFLSIVSLPYMLSGIVAQARRIAAGAILICGLGFYMYYDIAVLEDHEVVPYETIIGHDPTPYDGFDYRSRYRLG